MSLTFGIPPLVEYDISHPVIQPLEVHPMEWAAMCTRTETDRSRLRKAIAQPGNKGWLLKGVQFASVLDHLWHGAAANGAPITWNDYVNSRKATVHIDA
ncbi:hypothetical protein FRC10_012119 [Ceratobasidium sp. 414]|nr:hypothetical protein FRC10_012119 [Ceratobasidium sp. 414]